MLTFEEFFQKKKIDLQQLQQAEPALFAEFSKHFSLMGEKSFDHTKKYWFNQLRRTYPLPQEVKPHKVQAEAISQTAVQGVAVAAAQNLNEAIERPKFKEDNLPELVEENVPEKDVSMIDNEILIIEDKQETSGEPSTPKPAFKPRFNPKNIKKPELEEEINLGKSEEEKSVEPELVIEPAKPAFKPRFNMQNIKKDVVKEAPETESQTPKPEAETKSGAAAENPQPKTEPAKSAFKPRFNMQNIKKDVVKEASEQEIENVETLKASEQEELAAKPAYKPRFQMKNIKTAEQKPEGIKADEPAENPTAEPATENPEASTDSAENKEAKPVYKPRFQMKNMPKPPGEQA